MTKKKQLANVAEYTFTMQLLRSTDVQNSKKPNFTRLKISTITSILLFGGLTTWWWWGNEPVDQQDKSPQKFVITKNEGLRTIAKRLKDNGLIRDQIIFFLQVKKSGLDKNIQAGNFNLSPSMNIMTILETLEHGTEDIWVTIPEGWRKEEVAQKLNAVLEIPLNEFLQHAAEGYLFPDTYRIPKDASTEQVTTMMENNFKQQWDGLERKITQRGSLSQNLNQEQIVTIASIVEREARHKDDFPIVAGILLKRFQAQIPLEADATVQYALGFDATEKTWWKKNITAQDLIIDSPYNTRKNIGLPPTPISNPGALALASVISYKETPFWFYLSDKNGSMYYARTLEEHNVNINKYLR